VNTEKVKLASHIATILKMSGEEIAAIIEYPPQPHLGDLALPCFRFAKILRRSPQDIAREIAEALDGQPSYIAVDVAGGYVNVTLSRNEVATEIVNQARNSVKSLFSRVRHSGLTVAVDFSAPNIAKPFGVGHLRSTMIGQSIIRMLREDGYRVLGINHLGDWGTQFGKNIVAYLKWGDEETVKRDPVNELFKLYVRFHAEAIENPELDDEARAWFKRLEDGDEQALILWQWFIDESMLAFKKTYKLLGVEFDHYMGESFYNDKMSPVVTELRDSGLLVSSEGAEVIDLSAFDMPPCIILKSDGASIYHGRDIATAMYRHDVLGADKLVYVVGGEQTLHFKQVFKALELMGKSWAQDCYHVSFGMMKYNGERMSTRRGKVIYLEDVLNRAMAEARTIIEQKNPALDNKEDVARMVGIGAVVFNDLKTYRLHDVDFRYEDVLNFDGETGPNVQYAHARACSVLRKATDAGVVIPTVVSFTEVGEAAWRLIVQIAQANELFERAVSEYDPSTMARFVLDICHAFNRFYHDEPILSAPTEELRQSRLSLTDATRSVIAHALYLLGLEAPTAM